MFSIKKLIKSFSYAFTGLKQVFFSEQNMRVHIAAAILAIVLGFVLKISRLEFAIILLCIGMVIALEIVNSSVEKLCDFIFPQYHEKIKLIKDMAASAVLIMAAVAAIIGCIIFLPRMI